MLRWWRAGLAKIGVRTPEGRDTFVAALLVVLAVAGFAVASLVVDDPRESQGLELLGLAVLVADLGSIALRRRAPLVALAVATAAGVVSHVAEDPNAGLGVVVAAYSVGAYLPRRRAVRALALAAAVSAVGDIGLQTLSGPLALFAAPARGVDPVSPWFAAVFAYGVFGLLGAYVQTRRAYTAELVARAERLEREREERAQRAVADERNRIARELHDVAAHHLSAIIVQAGAADRLIDRDPAAAHAALEDIRSQGRETLTALRQLVGIMRAGDSDTDGRAPQPTLARIDRLVAEARDHGMTVEVTTAGADRPVPPAVDLAAYRVVQEALSNVRRHAPGATTQVTVTAGAAELAVTVRNSAPPEGWSAPRDGDGYGLLGMRERVQQAGGTLTVGATRDGGWQVHAVFPLEEPR
ncbi:MAG TPA: sensor histidine kinase [Egibacteraceae bacterium]